MKLITIEITDTDYAVKYSDKYEKLLLKDKYQAFRNAKHAIGQIATHYNNAETEHIIEEDKKQKAEEEKRIAARAKRNKETAAKIKMRELEAEKKKRAK